MPELITCSACGRPFNAAFRKCPFCNAPVSPLAPTAATSAPASASKPVGSPGHGNAPPTPAATGAVPGPPPAPSAPPALDYAAIAERAIAANRPFLALEFHPAAISALDAFIDITWGEEGAAPDDDNWEPSSGKRVAIVSFGAFLGELMRREFGGEWRDDPERPGNPLWARVVLNSGFHAFTIAKVFKRLKNGVEDRLESLYLYVRQAAGAAAAPDEADGWVRQARHFDSLSRQDLAIPFYQRALALAVVPAKRAEIETLHQQSVAVWQATVEDGRSRAAAQARAQIAELAERGRRTLVEHGVRVDRGALTLVGLDTYVNETFGFGPLGDAQRQPKLELVLGAFLGMLLTERYRGQWKEQFGDSLAQSQVVWPSGLSTCPFELISKRLAQGGQVSVLAQVASLIESLRAQGDTEDPPEDPKDWMEQADDYAQKVHRLDLAVRMAKVALQCGGDGTAARLKLARWYRELGQFADAATHLDVAVRLEPRSAPVWLERARLSQGRGDAAAAVANARQASDLCPESADAHLLEATALSTEAQHAPALAAFERALELHPAHQAGLLGKARALLALDRASDAHQWLESFAARSDCEPERSFLSGLAADRAGDPVAAHQLFVRVKDNARLAENERAHAAARAQALAGDPAVQIAEIDRLSDVAQAVSAYARINAEHPELAEPWRERGVGLVMLGRSEEALECLRHAATIEPREPKSYDHEAVTLARLKRIDEALEALDRGLLACPGSGLLLSRKGVFLAMAGRAEEALTSFQAAILADPSYADVWAFKGDIEHQLGRNEQAIASLRHFLASKPGSQEKRVDVARRQLWSLEHPGRQPDRDRALACQASAMATAQAGDYGAALHLFDEAVAADSTCGEVWLNRGVCLHRMSRFDDALPCFNEAETLLGPSSHVIDATAACLLRLQRGDEALRGYDRLLARLPRSPEGLRGKARTLIALGRPAEALPIYQHLLARSPADTVLAKERAAALTAAGRPVEALAAYQALIALSPDDVDLRTTHAAVVAALGRGPAPTMPS